MTSSRRVSARSAVPMSALQACPPNSVDFNEQMKDEAPFVFAFVLVLAFVLLLITFRSIVFRSRRSS